MGDETPDNPAQGIEDLAQRETRCGASGLIKVRYGATKAHSSSLTSVGYGLRGRTSLSIPQAY